MTHKVYVPEDGGWLQQTDWCGDFQPALLGAPRTLDETSQKLTEVVQEEIAQTLQSPEGENSSHLKHKTFFARLLFSVFGK